MSANRRLTIFQETSERFPFSWGEKAGMRASVITILETRKRKAAKNKPLECISGNRFSGFPRALKPLKLLASAPFVNTRLKLGC